jgi:hypothetical protein
MDSAVFIQCVGSRNKERPYCSKVCCTHSVKSALKLKESKPEMDVFIIYRDMRTYGLREELYREARAKGVVFIRYDFDKGLTVSKDQNGLNVRCTSYVLQREIEIKPDILVLATAIVAPQENPVAQLFKVPVNDNLLMRLSLKVWEPLHERLRCCPRTRSWATPSSLILMPGFAGGVGCARRSARIRPSTFTKTGLPVRSIRPFARAAAHVPWPVPPARSLFYTSMTGKY